MAKIMDRRPDPLRRQIQRALLVRMPPIAENKHEAYALELKKALEKVRLWQILFGALAVADVILALVYFRTK